MGSGSFDKNYMAEMVKEHGEAAQLFKQEAESGRVASLKQLASNMLPAVSSTCHSQIKRPDRSGQTLLRVPGRTGRVRSLRYVVLDIRKAPHPDSDAALSFACNHAERN